MDVTEVSSITITRLGSLIVYAQEGVLNTQVSPALRLRRKEKLVSGWK